VTWRARKLIKMTSTTNVALLVLVAVLMMTPASTQARYIQYELYSTEDCKQESLLAKGIAAGDGICVPNVGDFFSTKFTCSGLTNFPASPTCEDNIPDLPAELKPFSVGLGGCAVVDATATTKRYIRYACQFGGFVVKAVTTTGLCSEFEATMKRGLGSLEFFRGEEQCTPEFDLGSTQTTGGAGKMVVVSETNLVFNRWLESNDCTGPADNQETILINSCVLKNFTSNDQNVSVASGGILYTLTSVSNSLGSSSPIMIVLMMCMSAMMLF